MVPVYQGEYGEKNLVALFTKQEDAEEFVVLLNTDPDCQRDFSTDYSPVYVNEREELRTLDLDKWKAGWRYWLVAINHSRLTVQATIRQRPDYIGFGIVQKVVFAQTSEEAVAQVVPIWESKYGPIMVAKEVIGGSGKPEGHPTIP
jgi:hypothetical protein